MIKTGEQESRPRRFVLSMPGELPGWRTTLGPGGNYLKEGDP